MSNADKYVRFTSDEKQVLEKARESTYGEGRRVALGTYARILAERALESGEAE